MMKNASMLSGPPGFRALICALLVAGLPLVSACQTEVPPCEPTSDQQHQDLLTGYELLKDTLADESKLQLLTIFKRIFASGTAPEIEELMGKISDSANSRGAELKKIREQQPDFL